MQMPKEFFLRQLILIKSHPLKRIRWPTRHCDIMEDLNVGAVFMKLIDPSIFVHKNECIKTPFYFGQMGDAGWHYYEKRVFHVSMEKQVH